MWDRNGRTIAPNGGVMRTSVLGLYMYHDLDAVVDNARAFCKVTHADPRYVTVGHNYVLQTTYHVWNHNKCTIAPNGGFTGTSVLGLCMYHDLNAVTHDAHTFCRVTHVNPCKISVGISVD